MSTVTHQRRSLMDELGVDVPEGTSGDVTVKRFEVTKDSLANLRLSMEPGNRACLPGTYTAMTRAGSLWMSDTTAERRDHITPALAIDNIDTKRVLIGGLGLGCILRVALLTPTVEHVDVVEIDPDVIALVGPHYEKMAADAGVTLVIHEADLYQIKWPTGTHWDVAWFDIWPDLCTDNLEQMTKLRGSYGRRTTWQGCWGRELLLMHRAREQRSGWGW